jgi:hypothetical protein
MWKFIKRLFGAAAETAPQHNVVPIAQLTINSLFDADLAKLKNRQHARRRIETNTAMLHDGCAPPPRSRAR